MMFDKNSNSSYVKPIDVMSKDSDMAYKFACFYMGKTELHDRSLTDMRSPYDSTSAFIPEVMVASESNRYAFQVYKEITDKGIRWKDVQEEISKHINYSAQMWVDEYKRLCC